MVVMADLEVLPSFLSLYSRPEQPF
jgi:hypothetical protein